MKKRIICAVVAVWVCCFGFSSSSVINAEANLLWNNTDIVTLDLSFEETRAHINVNIIGDMGVSRITANIKLCCKDENGDWTETVYTRDFETDTRVLSINRTVAKMKMGEYALFVKGMVLKDGKVENISVQAYEVCTDGIPEERDEIEYHRALGMTIIGEGNNGKGFYDRNTYEGLYQSLVDRLYRTKLDIELLRKYGDNKEEHNRLYDVATTFLTDKQPVSLLPRPENLVKGRSPSAQWMEDLYSMAELDEERLMADEELVALYTYVARGRAVTTANYIERFRGEFPLLCEMIFGTPPVIVGQRFEPEMCRTLIDVTAEPDAYLVYERFNPSPNETQYSILGKDRTIELSPTYSGPIYVAKVNENGTFSEAAFIEVKSAVDLIPAEEVTFVSARLESAVRAYLGKDATEPITKAELTGITDLFINGDTIILDASLVTVELYNRTDYATVNDFSFADIDNFLCLDSLTVRNNTTGDPYGNVIRMLSRLELSNCGITDLSALKGSAIWTLKVDHNQITDASVLESFGSLGWVILNDNPLTTLALPARGNSLLSINNTFLTNLDFLANVKSMFQFVYHGTPITDVTPLYRFTTLNSISRPDGMK